MKESVQLTIRPFKLSDLDSVHDIERRSFPHPWSRLEFMLSQRKKPHGFLVAAINGEVVGYIIADVVRRFDPRGFQIKRRGHLLNIAVDPAFRHRGIGETLVKAGIAYLQGEGVEDVWLEVRASNLTARNFYLRMGFKEKGRKLRYYFSEDAVVMAKEL